MVVVAKPPVNNISIAQVSNLYNRDRQLAPNGTSNSLKAEEYYQSSDRKYHRQDDRGSLADLDRAIQVKPDFADAHRRRGILKANIFQDV
jgi:hypothetical protein